MTIQSRPTFLQALGSVFALPAALRLPGPRTGNAGHDFIAPDMGDGGAEPMWHGYPDECYSYTTFADSLVALAWGYGWYMQPPMVEARNAIIVDFASHTESEANASILGGWNGAWEFPMGTVNSVHDRVETNHQNARISRHLSLIVTGMMQGDFHRSVVEPLLDPQSCGTKDCDLCVDRPRRHLADVFKILAEGTSQGAVQLFSRWMPSTNLRTNLAKSHILIVHHDLDAIPAADLEANRQYHIWDGTPLQAEEFRKVVWIPRWKQANNGAQAIGYR
jgi:hypothetical protein